STIGDGFCGAGGGTESCAASGQTRVVASVMPNARMRPTRGPTRLTMAQRLKGVALDMAPALDGTTSSDGWQTATYFCIVACARGYKHAYKDGYLLTQRAIGQRSRSWFGTTRLTP